MVANVLTKKMISVLVLWAVRVCWARVSRGAVDARAGPQMAAIGASL